MRRSRPIHLPVIATDEKKKFIAFDQADPQRNCVAVTAKGSRAMPCRLLARGKSEAILGVGL
jgi:hypothetical protein